MFGWCQARQHDKCRVRIQKWYHGKRREGRKTVDAIIYTEDWKECDCRCHKPTAPKTKKKATRRKK